jgi:mRNA (guanine-N7-)-methyltransferase
MDIEIKQLLFDNITKLTNDKKTLPSGLESELELEFEIRFGSFDNNVFNSYVNNSIFELVYKQLKKLYTFDVSYSLDIYTNENSERITINGIKNIKEYCTNNIFNVKQATYITKEKIKSIDLEDYNIRLSLSTEKTIPEIKINDNIVKTFRYKCRCSFTINNFRIDLTIVKESKGKTFQQSHTLLIDEKYEIECEYISKLGNIKIDDIDIIYNILLLTSGSFIVISEKYKNEVLNEFNKYKVSAPKVKSLTKANLFDITKNQSSYAVTYKVDGLHHLLFVANDGKIYLIEDNKNVNYTGYQIDENKNSIYDCELLLHNDVYNILIFDCLYHNNVDVRQLPLIVPSDTILIKDMLIETTKTNVSNFNSRLNCIIDFIYNKPITKYKLNLEIKMKNYKFLSGDSDSESLFNKCSDLLKNIDKIEIDGLIIANIIDPYVSVNNSFEHIYKYKPIDKLSIDLLVSFIDNDNRVIYGNQECRKFQLMAYKTIKSQIKLVPFEIAYLPTDKFTTKNNEVILNNNVIEFIYDDNQEFFKWIPLRLRPDKTIIKMPNALITATSTFDLIKNPITYELITGIEKLDDNEFVYRTGNKDEKDIIKNMREFHNLIKSDLIKLSANAFSEDIKLIDFSCGEGGDLDKWYHSGINYVTGIDYSLASINEAKKRYNKKKYKDEMKVDFIQGDLTLPIEKCSKGTDDISSILAVHQGTYNIASCQFAIHYFFKDIDTINTFLQSVYKTLAVGGIFIGTTLNGKLVDEMFVDDEINIDSIKFSITKKYKKFDDYGNTIIPKIAGLVSGVTEWLVNFDFFKKCAINNGFEVISLQNDNKIYKFGTTFKEIHKYFPQTTLSKDEQSQSYLHSILILRKSKTKITIKKK